MTKVEERDYQLRDIKEISHWFSGNVKSVLYCLPTGGGKTVVIAGISSRIIKRNKKVLIVTDREELLDGSAEALVRRKIHPFMINRKSKRLNISHHVYVAMSQTLKRRCKVPDYAQWLRSTFDYVFIDECHKEEFNFFFEQNLFGNANIIGLTATPKRRGKSRQLYADYEVLIQNETTNSLIQKGWLCRPNYIVPELETPIEWGEMKTQVVKGEIDYKTSEVARVMDNKTIYTGMINVMKTETKDTVTLVFCANSAKTIKTCIELNEAGIPAKYLISEPDEAEGKELHAKYKSIYSGERKKLLASWKRGDFKVMVNNGILTTGFDYPAIKTIVLNRRTMSENLMLQMIGRGSRPIPHVKTEFNIVDMADNLNRMGRWHEDRTYSLHHKLSEKRGQPPMKLCPKCLQDCFASQKECSNVNRETFRKCTYVFPVQQKKEVQVTFKVTKYNDLEWNDLTLEMKQKMSFEELEIYRQDKKYPQGWVRFVARETGRLEQYEQLKTHSANA